MVYKHFACQLPLTQRVEELREHSRRRTPDHRLAIVIEEHGLRAAGERLCLQSARVEKRTNRDLENFGNLALLRAKDIGLWNRRDKWLHVKASHRGDRRERPEQNDVRACQSDLFLALAKSRLRKSGVLRFLRPAGKRNLPPMMLDGLGAAREQHPELSVANEERNEHRGAGVGAGIRDC